MIRIDAVLSHRSGLDAEVIADWVARGWVHAEGDTPSEWRFTEIEVARLDLVRELHIDLALDQEAMPVVLSLLDQVHDLRRALRLIMEQLAASPETSELRAAILAALSGGASSRSTLPR